ncbi:hypothetical protein J5N97_003638 [Dioscorea zingiberensis]|uniref:Uncharacterized protein n=1 Tax=Dioscorea zingiberensis TaxID=325984 RepID=A0A9D5D6C5_9LILI|nr:hypothetical protein J5N97_003638 [Dioscorea zingiberensis]
MERLDESQVANCIFYSSPSATDESLYNVAALNSELFFGGQEGSYSSSLASDLQVEISEFGSPPRRTEMNVISEGFVFNHRSTGEDSTSGSQDISVNFAEENDSVPREESMISEHDVIRMVYPEADTDFSDSVISMVPEPAAVQLVHRPNLSSEVNGKKDSPVDVEASLECDWNESISLTSYPEEHECLRNPTDRIDLEEFQPSVLDLPPIPEHLHESVLEQEHDSSEEPAPMVSFTGLQLFEEYNVDPYDLQDALSSPQPQSPKENRTDVNSKSLIHELEESDALISSPGVSFSDSSFSGLYAVNQSEIRDDSETRCSSGLICSEMESGEVRNELKDLKEIDEDLLSELDVVGDFYAAKPTLNQELSGMELPFVSDGIGRVESCEDKSLEVPHLSSKLPAETMDETKLVVEQPTLTILEMDPEQTVYKSKLHVLEAFSHEDIGLVPDQLVEGAALPLAAEPMVEKHITTNPEVGSSGSDASDKDQEPRDKFRVACS